MQIAQIGMNSSDIAGSLRLYAEALGFQKHGMRREDFTAFQDRQHTRLLIVDEIDNGTTP